MLVDLSVEANKVGLKLHMGTTKILSNVFPCRGVQSQRYVTVLHEQVEVLLYGGTTPYLGRQVCLNEFHDTEIRHRINKGWTAFGKYNSVDGTTL